MRERQTDRQRQRQTETQTETDTETVCLKMCEKKEAIIPWSRECEYIETLAFPSLDSASKETRFKVLFSFFAPWVQKAKLHSHTTFLMNKYLSSTNKQLPHFIYKKKEKCSNTNQSCYKYVRLRRKNLLVCFFVFCFFVVFRYWLNQNNSRIQLINLASLMFLGFDVIFMRLQNLGTLGWCI